MRRVLLVAAVLASALVRADLLPEGFRHATARVNGVRLHYVIGGRGTPVVLLHGFPATWVEWVRVMPALAQRHTVIVPDYRGAGDSERPVGGYDKLTMAEDVRALVASLGLRRVDLVGHDIGLMVAYAYAALHPDEVARLALLDAPLPATSVYRQIKQSGLAWWFELHAVPDLPEALVAGRERDYVTWFFRNLAANGNAMDAAETDEIVRAYSEPGAMRAAFALYRAFPRDETDFERLYAGPKLPMPVLALGGDRSAGPFIVEMLRPLATDVSGGALEDCGHWLAEERPAELARRLLEFLGRTPPHREPARRPRTRIGRGARLG